MHWNILVHVHKKRCRRREPFVATGREYRTQAQLERKTKLETNMSRVLAVLPLIGKMRPLVVSQVHKARVARNRGASTRTTPCEPDVLSVPREIDHQRVEHADDNIRCGETEER